MLSMGSWIFRPGLASTLVVLVLMPILISLGYWQLGRMHFKDTLQKQQTIQMQATPLDISIIKDISTLRFSPLQVTGHFLNDYPILVDNQTYKGQTGYRVIMPFEIKNSSLHLYPLLLIDRGWVPTGSNRSKIPYIKPITGEITLIGILNTPPKSFTLSAQSDTKIQFPLLIQAIDFEMISTHLKHTIFPMLLQLQVEQSPYTYQPLPITFGMPAHRHLGYALQWFAMACAVLIYYFVINTKKK